MLLCGGEGGFLARVFEPASMLNASGSGGSLLLEMRG
jgi:hypothetical protein